MPTVRVIGPGRAGLSFGRALGRAGWAVLPALGRGDDVAAAGEGADLVLLATPDAAVAGVARGIRSCDGTVVAHVSGSLTLEVLAPHARRGSVHPLVALPDPVAGADLLRGAWFAVAGDPLVDDVAAVLGGRSLRVPEEQRAAYHAAATIASNHLVALLGQVERVAAAAGVPLAAYLGLARATLDNVTALGPAAALTGPVARSDWATVAAHIAALAPEERDAYRAMAALAGRLVDREPPWAVPEVGPSWS